MRISKDIDDDGNDFLEELVFTTTTLSFTLCPQLCQRLYVH